MVAVAWVCYGFGISPAYYAWGLFSTHLIEDLSLSRTQFGAVFGVFTLLYSCVGFIVGPAMGRWSIRAVMSFGFVTSAIGFFYLSRADSLLSCIIGFSIFGGVGIGFATIIPCQTIGQNWFLKRRALAIALILIAGGIVGKGVARVDNWILAEYTWRTGWLVIGCISAALAVFAAIFVRDTPEQVGLRRDGATEEEEAATLSAMLKTKDGATQEEWTGKQAIRTKTDDALAHRELGSSYAALGKYKESVDAFKQAILINPNDDLAYFNLGLSYNYLNNYPAAVDAFKQALRIKKDDKDSHYMLGLTYIYLKDKNSALDQYKILKNVDKELANKLFNLIYP